MDELDELFKRKRELDEEITNCIRDDVFEGDHRFQELQMERDEIEERIDELLG